ncbi:M24 family metallopeptidase [Amphibacillus cookii]|uniref:M24 family metallopeptidase n=1 Tax=Amphibacillus cookii TaxID=767787 RepID=UPI00195D8875|nr:Xaa-Pro peptidase family protein [Amphibacillus cookii]MBM7542425.1 Xaa-Pro aminopeptidase [Amphibacillus cookii]
MDKIKQVREVLIEQDLDALIITNAYNRRYISQFTGTAGVVLITRDKQFFITDFRYIEQANQQALDFEIIEHKKSAIDELHLLSEQYQLKRIGFEQNDFSFAMFQQYDQRIEAKLIPTDQIIENIRMIKTDEELAIMQEAAYISDAAYDHILKTVQPGMGEIEVANELEFFMRKKGATSSSFDIIVASGYRSALPHGVASEKKIENGELVTLDFGALYQGYCSDMTRTFAVGEISEELHDIYSTVLDAHLKGLEGTKAGLTGKEADALARDYIKEKGYGQYFGHGTGHGLGLEVHESPRLAPTSTTVLKENMVVTVEPGIYIPKVGGCRIEDDIIITADGNRSLNKAPKELIIL